MNERDKTPPWEEEEEEFDEDECDDDEPREPDPYTEHIEREQAQFARIYNRNLN